MALKKEAARQKYLDVFELDTNASAEDIKKAYKKLALQYHPDKNLNDPESTQKFQELSKAYLELTKSKDVLCTHCGCGCDYEFSDDDDDDYEDEDDWYFESDSEEMDDNVMDDNVFYFGRIFMDVFSEFIFKRRFNTRKRPPNQRYTQEEQEEDSFFDFIFRKYRTPEDSDYVLTEEDLKKFHSYDEWLKSRDPKKRHNHRMRKAKKKANRKMPGEKPKSISKKQLLAEQRRREKEMKEIGENIQSKIQQGSKKPKKTHTGGDAWEENRVLRELEVIQDENRKREIEIEQEQKKYETQEKLKEKRKKKKEMKEMKKQVQSEAKKKLQDQEDLKPVVEDVGSTDMVQRYMDKQNRLFGSKTSANQRINSLELFPMGNVRADDAYRERDVKCGLLQQHLFNEDQNNNTANSTDTLTQKSVEKGDKSSLLDYHLKQYKELMKVQPVRHTEQQIKEERTRQKEVQLQRKHQELEKLRDKHKENYQFKAEEKRPTAGFTTVEDEEFERMRKEYLHKQQERERMRNEEEIMELKNKRAQTQKWVQKVEPPKWYEKSAPDPGRTVPEPPKIPKSNVWSTRQKRLQNMEMMRPRNEMDEEAILRKVLEESQKTVELDEQRRRQIAEMNRARRQMEKDLAAKTVVPDPPVEQPFVRPKPIESIWDMKEDPPLPVKSAPINPVSVWVSNPLINTKPAKHESSSQPQKSSLPKVTDDSPKYPNLKTSFSNLHPNVKLHIPEKTITNDDWDDDLKDQYLPEHSPSSFHQYMKWQPVAKAMLEQQKEETQATSGNSIDQLDNFDMKDAQQVCKSQTAQVRDTPFHNSGKEFSSGQTHTSKSSWIKAASKEQAESFTAEPRVQSIQGQNKATGFQKPPVRQKRNKSFGEDWEDDIDDVVTVWPSTTQPHGLESTSSVSKCEDHAQHIHEQVLSKVVSGDSGNESGLPERSQSLQKQPNIQSYQTQDQHQSQSQREWTTSNSGTRTVSARSESPIHIPREQSFLQPQAAQCQDYSEARTTEFTQEVYTDRQVKSEGSERGQDEIMTVREPQKERPQEQTKLQCHGHTLPRMPKNPQESSDLSGHSPPVGNALKPVTMQRVPALWKHLVKHQAKPSKQDTNVMPDSHVSPTLDQEQIQNQGENTEQKKESARNLPLRLPRLPKALYAMKRYHRSDNVSSLETSVANKQQPAGESQKISGQKLVRDLLNQQADPEFLKSLSEIKQDEQSPASPQSPASKPQFHTRENINIATSENNPLLNDRKSPAMDFDREPSSHDRSQARSEVKRHCQPKMDNTVDSQVEDIKLSQQSGPSVTPDNLAAVTAQNVLSQGLPGQSVLQPSLPSGLPQGLPGQSVLQPSLPSGLPQGLPPYLVQAYLQYLNQSSKGETAGPTNKVLTPAPQAQAEASLAGYPLAAGVGLGGMLPVPAMMPFVGLPNPMMQTEYMLQQKQLLEQQQERLRQNQQLLLQQQQQLLLSQNLQHGNGLSPLTQNLQHGNGLSHLTQNLQHGNGLSPLTQNLQHGNGLSPLTQDLQHGNGLSPLTQNLQHGNGLSPLTGERELGGAPVLQTTHHPHLPGLLQSQHMQSGTPALTTATENFNVNPTLQNLPQQQQRIIRTESMETANGAGDNILLGQDMHKSQFQHSVFQNQRGETEGDSKDNLRPGHQHQQDTNYPRDGIQQYNPPPSSGNIISAQQFTPPSVPGNIPPAQQYNPPAQQYNPPSVPGNIPPTQQYNPPPLPGHIPTAQQYKPPSVPGNIPSVLQYNPPSVPGNIAIQQYKPPSVPGNIAIQQFTPPSVPENIPPAQQYNPLSVPGNIPPAQQYNPPPLPGHIPPAQQYKPPSVPGHIPPTQQYNPPSVQTSNRESTPNGCDMYRGNTHVVEQSITRPRTSISPVENLGSSKGDGELVKDPSVLSVGKKYLQLPPKLQRRQEQTRAVQQMINKIHMESLEMDEDEETAIDKEQRCF